MHATAVVLAAGALHSPRLLQRYLKRLQAGAQLPIANVAGRYLKLHLLTAVVALTGSRKSDLIRKTTLLLNDTLPHSSIQPLGFDGELIGTLIPGLVPRLLARELGERAYGFFLQTEDGSHRRESRDRRRTAARRHLDTRLRRAAQRTRARRASETHRTVPAGAGKHRRARVLGAHRHSQAPRTHVGRW